MKGTNPFILLGSLTKREEEGEHSKFYAPDRSRTVWLLPVRLSPCRTARFLGPCGSPTRPFVRALRCGAEHFTQHALSIATAH